MLHLVGEDLTVDRQGVALSVRDDGSGLGDHAAELHGLPARSFEVSDGPHAGVGIVLVIAGDVDENVDFLLDVEAGSEESLSKTLCVVQTDQGFLSP